MIDGNKEEKQETNEEGNISCQFSYFFSILRSDLEWNIFVYDWNSDLSILQTIVQLYFIINLFSYLQQSYLLISLSFTFDSHHNTVFGIGS